MSWLLGVPVEVLLLWSVSGLGGLGLTLLCPVACSATLVTIAWSPLGLIMKSIQIIFLVLDRIQVHWDYSISPVVVTPVVVLVPS